MVILSHHTTKLHLPVTCIFAAAAGLEAVLPHPFWVLVTFTPTFPAFTPLVTVLRLLLRIVVFTGCRIYGWRTSYCMVAWRPPVNSHWLQVQWRLTATWVRILQKAWKKLAKNVDGGHGFNGFSMHLIVFMPNLGPTLEHSGTAPMLTMSTLPDYRKTMWRYSKITGSRGSVALNPPSYNGWMPLIIAALSLQLKNTLFGSFRQNNKNNTPSEVSKPFPAVIVFSSLGQYNISLEFRYHLVTEEGFCFYLLNKSMQHVGELTIKYCSISSHFIR